MPRRSLVIILLVASGCLSTDPGRFGADEPAPRLSAQRLTLEDYASYFSNRVEAAADQIIGMNLSPAISRNAVFWKIRVIPLSQRMLDRADDQAAYLNLWLMVEQMDYQMREGQGKDLFGAAGPIAVSTSKEVAEAVRKLGPTFLEPAQLAKAEKDVAAQVKSSERGAPGFSPEDMTTWSQSVSSTLRKPLDVVRAPLVELNPLGTLSDTASAVERVVIAVRELLKRTDSLPKQIRWSLQLAELELTEDVELVSAVDSFAKVSDSSVVLADTVKALPSQLRDEMSQILSELDGRQAGLEEMLDRVSTIVASTDQTGQSLTRMGEVWTELVRTLTLTIDQLDKPSAEPAAEKGPPFDINDYRRTADELTKTAAALSDVLTQVQQLTSPEEASSLTRVLDSAVRRALMSLGLFVLFVALVMLGYRWAVGRLA